MLTLLALRANQVVPPEELVDALWGPAPPMTAAAGLRVSVSKLRRALGAAGAPGALVTRTGGYVLELGLGRTDIARFEGLVDRARVTGDPAARGALLDEALALWRGSPLTGLDHDPVAVSELLRLEEVRSLAVEDRIDCKLAQGHHRELVPELEALVAAAPLRERRQGQLMRALNGSGRQAEALETYRRFREHLVDELGLEPGPDLREVEQTILRQERPPERAAATPAGARPRVPPSRIRRRTRWLVAAGVAVCLAVSAAGVANGWWVPDAAEADVELGTMARLDPDTGAVLGQVDVLARVGVGDGFGEILVGEDIWVLNEIDHTVSRIDIDDPSVTATVAVGSDPIDLALAGGDVWVTNAAEDNVVRVDGASGAVVAMIPVGGLPSGITEAEGDIWVANHRGLPSGSVWRIDAETNVVIARIPVGARDTDGDPRGSPTVPARSGSASPTSTRWSA